MFKYGFVRGVFTGRVDTTKVFSTGRYLMGPHLEFKKFPSSAQFVSYSHIPIFTNDNLQVYKILNQIYVLVQMFDSISKIGNHIS